jgi:dihydrofolate reductase
MKSAIVVAVANNNVIGCNNQLPWRLPQDLAYFKKITLKKPVIMGRKTYESIGKPLSDRLNIVVTRQENLFLAAGVLIAKNVKEAFALAEKKIAELNLPEDEIMIIGGAEIYREALQWVDRIYLTRIDLDVEGDAFFPELSPQVWRLDAEIQGDAAASLRHTFCTYTRKMMQK